MRLDSLLIPNAVTTTSPRFCESKDKLTVIVVLLLTATSCVPNPTELNCKVSVPAAATEKRPLLSVVVAIDFPFTVTVTPETGLLEISVTVPVTVCARLKEDISKEDMRNKYNRMDPGFKTSFNVFFINQSFWCVTKSQFIGRLPEIQFI